MLNKVEIIGRLGKDPEMTYTPSGSAVTRVSVATDRRWNDQKSGEKKQETTWFNVVFWNKQAEIANTYLRKGQLVYVEGRIQTRQWDDNNGVRHYVWELVANSMLMLERGASAEQQEARESDLHQPLNPDTEDIPF